MKILLTISVSLLILTACTNSNWMADGYRWHDHTPISKAAPTSSWNDKTHQADIFRGDSLQAVMSGVSADMLDTLETHLSRTTPIYLSPREKMSSQGAVLDHALRENLRERGYTLSSTRKGAHILAHDIEKSTQTNATATEYIILLYGLGQEEEWHLLEQRIQELPSS